MALIDVVKWDALSDELVWKFPSEELSTATRLIVSASQEAVVLLGGQISGVFGPGTHILDTNNIPFLRNFIKIPFGNRTPYSAEVWFVQKTTPLDLLWGTMDPVPVMDPQFNVPIPLRCHGQFGIQVSDSSKFFLNFVGTTTNFDTEKVREYFKALIQSRVKSLIAKEIISKNCSVFELGQYLDVFSSEMKELLREEFQRFGVLLVNFFIQSINFPQDDPVVASLKESLAKRADMRVLGYTYTQERSFDVLQGAAENEGTAGSLTGAGIGLGLGTVVGGTFGNTFAQATGNTLNTAPQGGAGAQGCCIRCNAPLLGGGKFCSECGAVQYLSCCGKTWPGTMKFCPECGRKLSGGGNDGTTGGGSK